MNTPEAHASAADILVVDDTPDNLRLLSIMLSENGYKVRKAINGERALQAVQAIAPDLILLDIRMPDMTGYEVCRHLKESEYRDIPVIFISALDDVFDKVMAFDVGGVDYINKPFQGQEVLARINTHLKIKKLQNQLQHQNTQLQQEVCDRIAAEAALKTLNQELEMRVQDRTSELQTANEQLRTLEANLRQQLNVFLNAVSHDLRNPVMGTSMVLNNLSQQSGEAIAIPRAILDRMIQSNARQLDLIDSLIETHAVEVWGINLNCQSMRLHDLVQGAIADLQPLLEREQATLVNLIPTALPLVKVDPLQLSRVYQNLIANALKHNPPGLKIVLNAEPGTHWVRCTVHDNGVGVDPDQQHKLFDLYFQGSQKRKSVGLGLGLYLCQQIIQAHGGEIGIESQPQQGATFWFTLPVCE
ncbi:hybrid sensor histidine kinase/response regulator [Oscillatoria sp. FACHB-1407]|uniref:ATP-binding response regulator n=1 Tax=Oscillatoria sp. FACHB-1407 TaxID=2692847 RepID=UPI001682D9EE|nr:hybrid sensor histidine kinase/response regulator [Oscillatoria sp. FACHB-1407]MBD2464828.1 hybrid sensor histidine kinase/response regulator [Oscillatoria sp. FACHB-1407]